MNDCGSHILLPFGMSSLLDTLRFFLAAHPLVALFATIGVGYLISEIRFKGVGIGVAAVLFVGLALGAFGRNTLNIPDIIGQIGLLLFVYTIGLQSGPGFVSIFRRRGLWLVLIAFLGLCLCALGIWVSVTFFSVHPLTAIGVFCGALTNTPALAATTEALHGSPDAALLTIGYSVAYPLGVILPIFFALFIARATRVNVKAETQRAETESGTVKAPPVAKNIVLTNSALDGKTIDETLAMPFGVKVSRVQREGTIFTGTGNTILKLGDVLRLVGTAAMLEQVVHHIGIETPDINPEHARNQVDFRRILLTNSALVGKTLGELNLDETWGVVVTRLRRGDTDFFPTDSTILERGDRLRVVASPEKLAAFSTYLGDSARALSETDYLSFSLGIVVGILLGQIPIPLGPFELKLGLAGGPLVAGLLLGWIGRTGSLVWDLPLITNATFRQFGLVLFFAAVGLKSGGMFLDAVQREGVLLLAIGGVLTLLLASVMLFGTMTIMKMDWVSATGALAGGHTQPAVLAFIGNLSSSEAPNATYVAVLPLAMIIKIIFSQLLLFWLNS
jgi:putative transport protein